MRKDQVSALLWPLTLWVLAFPLRLAADGNDDPLSVKAWEKKVETLMGDLRLTVARRDKLAFEHDLAILIETGATPRKVYRKALERFLKSVPSGRPLNSLIEKLVKDAHSKSLNVLFGGLSRQDYEDLAGVKLGQRQTEVRRRAIEFCVLQLGDDAYRSASSEGRYKVTSKLQERLGEGLLSGDERQVRCAAYLLGGARRKQAAPLLLDAALRSDTVPFTKAVLLEALGRADTQAGAAAFQAGAGSRDEVVLLAAVPMLGFLRSESSERLIKKAIKHKSWTVRRAAVEACQNRRDLFAMDLLMARFANETARLEYDMMEAILDITGGAVPADLKEWRPWWRKAREGFKAPPRRKAGPPKKATTVVAKWQPPQYFGLDVRSNRLAIVLDTSGSMSSPNRSIRASAVDAEGDLEEGSLLDVAKKQIQSLLKRLRRSSSFTVVAYNQNVRAFSEVLLPASKSNVRSAFKFVKGLKADGGTNVYGALLSALRDKEVDTVFLLSDGEPTDGKRTEPSDILEAIQVRNRFRKTRIHTVQIGEDQDLMRKLAESNGGTYLLLETDRGSEQAPPR
jgi:hypothetical protein